MTSEPKRPAPKTALPREPLVSVIITNYNYGRFMEAALRSISVQTYPFIETLIVDDKSTDDSWPIIEALTGADGPFGKVQAVQTPKNCGQTAASDFGLSRTRGHYVIFMDADDVLLPSCVEAHVYAHLTSRIPVGLSSVDCFTVVDDQYVTPSAAGDFAAFVASGEGLLPGMSRPIEKAAPHTWFGDREPIVGAGDIHHFLPPKCEPWVWSPMSGICFRRSALKLFLSGPNLADITYGTDTYLLRSITSVCGAMLIDRPLMGYRVHGGNHFIENAPLTRLRNYNARDKQAELTDSRKLAVRKMFDDVESFGPLFEDPHFFYQSIDSQCRCWPVLEPETGGRSFLTECLTAYRAALVRTFGEDIFDQWWLQGHDGDASASDQAKGGRGTFLPRWSTLGRGQPKS